MDDPSSVGGLRGNIAAVVGINEYSYGVPRLKIAVADADVLNGTRTSLVETRSTGIDSVTKPVSISPKMGLYL